MRGCGLKRCMFTRGERFRFKFRDSPTGKGNPELNDREGLLKCKGNLFKLFKFVFLLYVK
jgi:hypothetical protein